MSFSSFSCIHKIHNSAKESILLHFLKKSLKKYLKHILVEFLHGHRLDILLPQAQVILASQIPMFEGSEFDPTEEVSELTPALVAAVLGLEHLAVQPVDIEIFYYPAIN